MLLRFYADIIIFIYIIRIIIYYHYTISAQTHINIYISYFYGIPGFISIIVRV